MAQTLGESRLVILNGKDDALVFLPVGKEKITVGSDYACDVRYIHDEVRDTHFAIYKNEKGETKIVNNSVARPIQVNGVEVPTKRTLNSGDVITLLGKDFRWELKEDAKRRKLSLSKTERKRQRAFCMKTQKRITIHQIRVTKKLEFEEGQAGDEQAKTKASSSDEAETPKTPTKDQSALLTSFSTPQASVSLNKENVTSSAKLDSLNLSGTLKTSFTPQKSASKRTPMKTPMKQALSESTSNTSDGETTPNKAKKSMYLIDLTTPHPTKTGVPSPSPQKSPKTTPTKKTVVTRHENTLLKSAIKNSTIKKNIEATPNRKVLTFSENDALQESGGSSLIELSMESESPSNGNSVHSTPQKPKDADQTADFAGLQKMLKTPQREPTNDLSNVSGVANLMKTPAATQQTPEADENEAKEVQELIDSISSVLDEHETAHHSDESLEHNASQTTAFDGSFSKALEGNTSSPSHKMNVSSMVFDDNAVSSAESKFDSIATRPSVEGMSSVDSKFDSLIGRPSISKTYQPAKKSTQPEGFQDEDDELSREKAESILSWVATARDSLAAESSNPVTQVNSSRYSNITNESSVSVKTLAYDATTPKIVNLQPMDVLYKSLHASSQKLTKSPVTRLSLNENNVIVENYAINNEIPKSLRSTRKHIGSAMNMMHNTSHVADTTIDPNETINMMSAEGELDQSKQEPVNILSLDNQPQSGSNGARGDFEEAGQPLNNFITFANSMDVQVEAERDIFEVSSNEESGEEELSQSDGYESSSSDNEIPDELEEKPLDGGEKSKSLTKFRLSEQDMEDGVSPLNDSRTDEEVPSSQDADISLNGEGEVASTDQSSVYCALAEHDAINESNFEMVEATQPQSTDEPAIDSQGDIFDSDFDMPATQAEGEQHQIEFQPQATIPEEESIAESHEAVTSSFVDAPEAATEIDTEVVEAKAAEIEEQLDEVEEQPSEIADEQPSQDFSEQPSQDFDDQPSEAEESQVDVTADVGTDNTPDLINDDSHSSNIQSSIQMSDFEIPATQVLGAAAVADSFSNDVTFAQNETALAEEEEVSTVEEQVSQVDEQPSEIFEEQPSEEEEETSKILEQQPSEVVKEQPSEVDEEQPIEIIEEQPDEIVEVQQPDGTSEDEIAGDFTITNSDSGPQIVDFDMTEALEKDKAHATEVETSANQTNLLASAEADNQTINAGNKAVPNETAIFTDTEFSRVDIPDELMESTVVESSEDELQGLTDAPNFTKRAPSMAPLAETKKILSRKTVAAQPEGEVTDALIHDMKQQHKQAVFGKMEEQQNLEAMAQRKSLAPAASARTAEVRKTIVPTGAALKPSFENFMKAKAQQLKEKEASDMEISMKSRSSEAKPQNNSVESSLRSTDIEVESSVECIELVTSTEEVVDGSASESTSQETSGDSQEPSQSDKTVDEKDSGAQIPVDQTSDENDFARQTPVVEEVCVKKKAYVCTEDEDEVVVEPEEAVAESAPAPVETPAIPETPRRRAAKVDYSALASGSTPRKLAEATKAAGTPNRRGRSASVDSKASVESATVSTTKRGKNAKKPEPAIQEEPEVVVVEDSTQEEHPEKIPEAKPKKGRGKKADKSPPTEVRVEITAKVVEEEAAQKVDDSQPEAVRNSKSKPGATQPTPEPEAAATSGEPSGRQRRGARVNYTDLVAGSKATGDTPKPSKRGQKAAAAEKAPEDAPVDVAPPATPEKVQAPEKSSKRTRKEVVKTSESEVVETPAEAVEEPVVTKRGRIRKPPPSKAVEDKGTPTLVATTSRVAVSKRKNAEPEEPQTPVQAAPEVLESPAPNKRKRRAASPAVPETVEEPAEPKVSARATKRGIAKAQSTIELPTATTSKEVVAKSKNELTKSKSTISTPVQPTRSLRETSRAKTPQIVEESQTKRRGRKEPVQSDEQPKEEAAAAPVKPTARNKRKLEAEKSDSSVEIVEEVAPTTSRRGRKQEVEKAPEAVVESLPKATSRRNVKKAEEEPPVEVPAVKTSRRGATKKVEATPPEAEEPTNPTPPKKARREAAKKVEEPVTESPPKKSRRDAAKKEEEPVEVPAKATKGKAKKAEVAEVEPEAPPKRGRGRKAATVEPESPEKAGPSVKKGAAKKQETVAAPSQTEAESKPARATKRNQPAEVEEQPIAKRATRAKK